MQPDNQPLPPVQSSPDPTYLDSIAVKPTVKTMNPLMLWGLIGGVLAVLVIAVALLAGGVGPSTKDKLTTYGAMISNLKTVSEDAQENIQSSQLRTLNSSLTLVLTNANRDLASPLKSQEISLKEKSNEQISDVASNVKGLNERLENARLNAVFDRTYAREIAFYLKTLRSEMSELYKQTRNEKLKTVLAQTDDTIEPLAIDFSSFKAD